MLYALGLYSIIGIFSIGIWIKNKCIQFHEESIPQMLLSFGIGLSAFLLGIYVLLLLNILFPIVTWIIFVGMGVLAYIQRKSLSVYVQMLEGIFQDFSVKNLQGANARKWIGIILLVLSIAYYLFGFQLSFIPYSTAWDANHAYMYNPRIWAENNGIFWKDGPITFPYLRYSFITFFFSLIKPISSRFWLSADNVGVNMNFLSGIFVLVFGLATIKVVTEYFGRFIEKTKLPDVTVQQIVFYIGWFLLLLWLTSGMGAFLVFIDNKTDLGIMAMTILAILSGFMFIQHASADTATKKLSTKEINTYVVVSGLMFGIAVLSKPTAFVDVAVFGLLLVGLRLGNLLTVGLGFVLLGIFGKLEILTSGLFVDS